jgi:hypothetical protein
LYALFLGVIMEEKREFKGVWIPREIWLNKELTWMEKLFLTEIDSLDKHNTCYASNNYFSEFFNISKTRSSQIINSLVKKGYIQSELIYNGMQIEKRVLKIDKDKKHYTENPNKIKTKINGSIIKKSPKEMHNNYENTEDTKEKSLYEDSDLGGSKYSKGGSKYSKGGSKYSKGGSKYSKGGYLENCKVNNTIYNNTINNTDIPRNSSFAMGDFPDGKIPKVESVKSKEKYTEDKTEILFSEIENLDINTHIPEIKKRFELKKEIQDMIPEEKEIEVAEYDIYDLDLDIEYSDNESEIENISTVKENEIQETEKINKMKNTKNEFFEPKKDTIKNTTPENSIISFWNKFPELATHRNRNTKLYKKANEYITALLDHSFVDTYEFDNNWKIDNNLRILPLKELTEKTLKSAIMDYTLCFEPEYRPENKEYLTKSIVDFIYNPITKKSQLLFILNHKPQLITKPDPSLARKHIPSEIASKVDNILSHKYSRINDLHRLEVYNNVLRTLKKFTEIKKLGKYQTHKSNFSYIKSIERLWLDYLSNRSKITKFDFSPDNFTFNNFIEYMENEYDVSLDTSEKNIRRLQRSYEKSLQSKQKEVKLVENELNIDDLLL